ncbi:aspartate ammonia-lyase [bacterium]|nr:aspartate ammonia-lyase [bacterium]NBX98337.1 aspartate ammonia-lyase [bacterium]NDC95431.1 aspartate ammonia-lyase [bacterium]NDG31809.1 aspartate ammonia-lyase [bacterium]
MDNGKTELTSLLSGVAGEYFVAAELSRRGYLASITLRNTKGVDILCSNSDATKTVAIQVKTNRRSNREWVLNQKAEFFYADNHFYVFVNLHNNKQQPDYFIVPSKVVATYVKETHAAWLAAPGKAGRAHIDTTMRKFADLSEEYRNCWDNLGLN